MTRREFLPKVKAAAFERCAGKCEGCGVQLSVGKFAYDHIIPDSHGGEPTLANCQVLCNACHGAKTAQVDTPIAAKLKRQRNAHIGAKQRGRGFPPAERRGAASRPLMKPPVPRRITQ